MKVLPFTIPKPKRDALIFQEDGFDGFYEHLHRHEEIQLSYIIKGTGAIVVGDTIRSFQAGDLFVLGSNLPHVFKSESKEPNTAHMASLFFTEDSFGAGLFQTEELKILQSLFGKASNGFRISNAAEQMTSLFLNFTRLRKLDRFIQFFQLLKRLHSAKSEKLSTFNSDQKYSDIEGQRMSAVFAYTLSHFRSHIPLTTIAKEANMTPNAFCSYFKKRTRKTYITFLIELRIEEASKLLLQESELSIPEIAEQCGFQNISNFNRKFKALKGNSPLKFRKAFKP